MTTEATRGVTGTPTTVAPLRKAERLVDQVVEHLRLLILHGDIEPGESLKQEELAERLGVSRTPLREAFRILERDGLVEAGARTNTVRVVELSPQDAVDLYQVRGALDAVAARLAAERRPANEAQVVGLARYVTEMADAMRPFDTRRYTDAHVAFHLGIVAASGNKRLQQLESVFRISAQMLYRRIGTNVERMERSNGEHREILTAISEGDPVTAERRAREHIERAIEAWGRQGT
jgi:DNA-binding GntR family transcriptional regulator